MGILVALAAYCCLQTCRGIEIKNMSTIDKMKLKTSPIKVRRNSNLTFVCARLVVFTLLAFAAATPTKAATLESQFAPLGDPEVIALLGKVNNFPPLVQGGLMSCKLSPTARAATVETQRQRLLEMVRALGYLDARVGISFDSKICLDADAAARATLSGAAWQEQFKVFGDLGVRYRVALVEIDGLDQPGISNVLEADIQSLIDQLPSSTASANVTSKIESEIIWRIHHNTNHLAWIKNGTLAASGQSPDAALKISIKIDKAREFGAIEVYGLTTYNKEAIKDLAPFARGESFDRKKLSSFAQRLSALDYFESISVSEHDRPDSTGQLPIDVILREKPPDPKKLIASGRVGIWLAGGALMFIALRQAVLIERIPSKVLRRIDLALLLLLSGTALVFVQRIWSFLGHV